jgi:hypothetical protein
MVSSSQTNIWINPYARRCQSPARNDAATHAPHQA